MATAASAKTKAGNGTRSTPEDMEAEIARLRADVAALADQLARTGEHSIAAARRAASQGAEQLRAQGEQLKARGEAAVESLRANAGDMERQVVDAVREKPITALAIAAGIGYCLAMLSRR